MFSQFLDETPIKIYFICIYISIYFIFHMFIHFMSWKPALHQQVRQFNPNESKYICSLNICIKIGKVLIFAAILKMWNHYQILFIGYPSFCTNILHILISNHVLHLPRTFFIKILPLHFSSVFGEKYELFFKYSYGLLFADNNISHMHEYLVTKLH